MKLKEVCNDLFDVAKRINRVDKNYFVVFNKDKNRFEVHHKKQRGTSLSFIVNGKLNASVIKKAIKTSIKFADEILKQVEKENCLLEKRAIEKLSDENMSKFKSYIDYANEKNCDVDFLLTNQVEWI